VISADLHTRSYAGLTYKEFAFGIGAHREYSGPLKHKESNRNIFAFGAVLNLHI
jgi:hypothetical protein